MKIGRSHRYTLLMFLSWFSCYSYANESSDDSFVDKVVGDYKAFYTLSTAQALAPGFLTAALMANTNIDQSIQGEIPFHDKRFTDHSKQVNYFGDSTRTIPSLPIYAATMGLDYWLHDEQSVVGKWGEYSLRTFLVGAPSGFLAANILGGSRPVEGRGSDWRLLDDVNSISGHSFSGAVPMINAAMLSESLWAKSIFYGLSMLPGLARVAMDRHYTSQAVLGWTFAYVSAKVVQRDRTDMAVAINYYRDTPVLTFVKQF